MDAAVAGASLHTHTRHTHTLLFLYTNGSYFCSYALECRVNVFCFDLVLKPFNVRYTVNDDTPFVGVVYFATLRSSCFSTDIVTKAENCSSLHASR